VPKLVIWLIGRSRFALPAIETGALDAAGMWIAADEGS